MRMKIREQMSFEDEEFLRSERFFPKDEVLEKMSKILDDNPAILDAVAADLTSDLKDAGNTGMTVEQVLRSAILYQLKGYSYRELAKRIGDCFSYRVFTRFYSRPVPDFTNLARAIKRIREETFKTINDILIQYSIEQGIEDGGKLRSDTTVVRTDIHHPTDGSLLWDCVRVLDRVMKNCLYEYPQLDFEYHDRTRAAKRRAREIAMVKGKGASKKRKAAYRKLLRTTDAVLSMACSCRTELDSMRSGVGFDFDLDAFIDTLDHFVPLTEKVIDQCRRRIIDGENVPASEKVVSIFEDHTDIIRRGKSGSPTEFGHKVLFSTGGSGLITQYDVCQGNPGDNDLVKDILDKHVEQFGVGPARFAGDRRFYSFANEQLAASGPYNVEYVSIPKPGRRSEDRRRHEGERWFKLLQRFRAGIEGVISALIRALGCTRCLWRGLESFGCYIGLSVFAFNLRKIAFVT